MKRALVAFSVVFATATASAGAPSWGTVHTGTWAHVTEKNHDVGKIEVLNRTVNDLPCFQGSTTTDVPAADLLAVAKDVASATSWSSAGVAEAKSLGTSGNTVDYYQYLDVPGWTFASDRFWFLKGTFGSDGNKHFFHWERLDDGGPYGAEYTRVKDAHPNAIEPPINVGGWLFTDNGGSTTVQYFICSDVGGTLPTSIQSMATKGTLPDTLADLIIEARKR